MQIPHLGQAHLLTSPWAHRVPHASAGVKLGSGCPPKLKGFSPASSSSPFCRCGLRPHTPGETPSLRPGWGPRGPLCTSRWETQSSLFHRWCSQLPPRAGSQHVFSSAASESPWYLCPWEMLGGSHLSSIHLSSFPIGVLSSPCGGKLGSAVSREVSWHVPRLAATRRQTV